MLAVVAAGGLGCLLLLLRLCVSSPVGVVILMVFICSLLSEIYPKVFCKCLKDVFTFRGGDFDSSRCLFPELAIGVFPLLD